VKIKFDKKVLVKIDRLLLDHVSTV